MRRKTARQMYDEGFSISAICDELDRAESTVKKYLAGMIEDNRDVIGKGHLKGALKEIPKHVEKADRIPMALGDIKNTVVFVKKGTTLEEARRKYGI